ncbi:DUF2283 domain-containing protein [Streptosporangium sp. NPDC020072]|uniref:DUF2283 domain-containing protein n=1 Tax=Streptosporangium jomthongense TaxID=1193683 RepID=A0ABV8F529_9ACTN
MEHDGENDVAYVHLAEEIAPGAARTRIVVEDPALRGEVILDLDEHGRLLGVEVAGASAALFPETLAESEQEGTPYEG